MKYINADKLIKKFEKMVDNIPASVDSGAVYVIDEVYKIIDSLQQEQPEVPARHGWVARDMNNDLHYFSVKPVRSGAKWWDRDYLSMEVDGALFGGLTWEDEPIEVELFIRELGLNARKD